MSREIIKFYDTIADGNGGAFEFGEWQLCPKCAGTGLIYDQFNNMTPFPTKPCDVCGGSKVLARPLLNNDKNAKECDASKAQW